jgi:K+-sensing histidine kinase KdpD
MKIMSRGLALALILGVSPVAVLVAQAARDMSPEARERVQEGRLTAAKTTLKLTAEQEKLWAPVEEQVRSMYKSRSEMRADWRKKRAERRQARKERRESGEITKRQRPNIAERYERMAGRMSNKAEQINKQAEQMKALSTAFAPFFASLSDDQKEVVGPVMRDLRVAKMVRGGHRHHGWHDGGWHKRWKQQRDGDKAPGAETQDKG